MRSNKVDSLLVIDKENVLKGIVTFKDIKITNEKSRALSEIMVKITRLTKMIV